MEAIDGPLSKIGLSHRFRWSRNGNNHLENQLWICEIQANDVH
jgi:hypothetical protein